MLFTIKYLTLDFLWRWLPGIELPPKWKPFARAFQREEITDLYVRCHAVANKMCIWWQNQNFMTIHHRQVWLHVLGGPYMWPRLTGAIQFRPVVCRLHGKWMLKAFPVIAAVLVIARRAGEQRLSRNISALPPKPSCLPLTSWNWHFNELLASEQCMQYKTRSIYLLSLVTRLIFSYGQLWGGVNEDEAEAELGHIEPRATPEGPTLW